MRYVGAFEAKTHFSQLLEEIKQKREPIVLQKRGKNIAFLEPYEEKAEEWRQERAERIRQTFCDIRRSQDTKNNSKTALEDLINEGRER